MKITDFIKALPADFFRLTDSLTVARTRQMIEKQKTGLHFPNKQKPKNIFVTPKQIGNFESFEELINSFFILRISKILPGKPKFQYIGSSSALDR